ncbi:Uncharacterised protein [Shigella sonnei]|nr:Uncharacterised protein [Shigella sonnei]
MGGENGFFRCFRPGSIWQQGHTRRDKRFEDSVVVLAQVDTFHRQCHQLAAGSADRLHHQL